MKRKHVFLAFLAAGLVLTGSIGSALAYFTTYVEARGGTVISLGDQTTVTEEFSQWTKHIRIASDENSGPVYVRAKAFCSAYEFVYEEPEDTKGMWTPGADGYYYYGDILDSKDDTKKETSELLVRILDVPSDEVDQKEFNVIVIYETTPVQYDKGGTQISAKDIDWNGTLDITRVEGGVE